MMHRQTIFKQKITMANGKLAYRTYRTQKLLGRGSFGIVWKVCRLEDNKIFALKAMNKLFLKDKFAVAKLNSQLEIHKRMKHKRICEMYTHFQDEQNIFMLLEYCQGQTLETVIKKQKKIAENVVRIILKQIIQGIEYLHANDIIHRDLKSTNIIWDQQTIKIIDFGLAVKSQFTGAKRYSLCGTPYYLAPEIVSAALQKPNSYPGYGKQVDIWAIGVIIYKMLVGQLPFRSNNMLTCYNLICMGKPYFPENISREAKDFLLRCLCVDQSERATIQQIKKHPFFTKLADFQQQKKTLFARNRKQLISGTVLTIKKNLVTQEIEPQLYLPISKYKSVQKILDQRKLSPRKLATTNSNNNFYACKSDRTPAHRDDEIQIDYPYLDWVQKGEICVYTLSNGYKGTYKRNEDLKLLYNNKDYTYFQIRLNQIEQVPSTNMTIRQQIAAHMKALAKSINLNESKCISYIKGTTQNLVYIKKFYEVKDSYYFARFSNGCYQLINYNTGDSILLDSDEQLIYQIKLLNGQTIQLNRGVKSKTKSNELFQKLKKIIHHVKIN